MECADVVEGDVGADVVERGGNDGLELGHVECVTVAGRHVEERSSEHSLVLLFKYKLLAFHFHPILAILLPQSRDLSGIILPSHPVCDGLSHYLIYPFMSSSLCWASSWLFCELVRYSSWSRSVRSRNLSHGASRTPHSSE